MSNFDFSSFKALVVEDSDFVRFLMQKYLKEFGFQEVFEATNGMDGLSQLGKQPDIILCDIQMEPLNGFEFLQHLRKKESPEKELPVIFLTSNSEAEHVRRALDLSVDAYLLKPVSPVALRKKITELMTKKMTA